MKKDEFLIKLKDIQDSLGNWNVELGEETFADFIIGCFFDETIGQWKVYVNRERGRHSIRLVTENEEEAFDKLLAIIKFQAENIKYWSN